MKNVWVLFPIGLFFQLSLFAGVVFEVETKNHQHSDGKAGLTRAFAEGKNLKMDIAAGRDGKKSDVIFHGGRGEMVIVDHKQKSYMVIDKKMIESLSGQISQATGLIADALKNVPAEQRAMVEKMMKERMPAQTPQKSKNDIKKTNERKKINGYPCVRHDVLREGRKIRELWVTDWKNIEGGDDAKEAFEALAKFFKQMMAAFGDMAGSQSPVGDNPFAEMDELGGFPVLSKSFDVNGELEDESTLKSSKRRRLDPAEFEPPSGYKRTTMAPHR